MPTPELSEHLWTGKGLVRLVRKGNLPGGGFQYKSGARESFVETKVLNSPGGRAARELAPDARSSLRLTPMSNHGGTREGAGRPAGSGGGRTVESRSVSMRSTGVATHRPNARICVSRRLSFKRRHSLPESRHSAKNASATAIHKNQRPKSFIALGYTRLLNARVSYFGPE